MRSAAFTTVRDTPETAPLDSPAVRMAFLAEAALEPDPVEFIVGALGPLTNREVAFLLGLSPSRVDQIERQALRKLARAARSIR